MADDLKRFIFEERNNLRRYKSNIESIIQKYDRHFADDAEIDLTSLKSHSVRDEKVVKKLQPKPFGHTKLVSTKKKELTESLYNGSCINKDESIFSVGNFSMQETTIQKSPSTRFSPGSERTFVKDNLSLYEDHDSITEDDPDFLALKTSYFEIISEKNDEPSDAETLSSYSSDESDRLLDEDDSEDGDDEDSQADDRIRPPFLPQYDNHDSDSLLSTEDNMDVVNLEFVKPKKKISPCTIKNVTKHKRIQDIKLQINCLQSELENVKKEDIKTKNAKKVDTNVDEVDGDFPVQCIDQSGYSGKERSTTNLVSYPAYNTERIVARKNPAFHLAMHKSEGTKDFVNSSSGTKVYDSLKTKVEEKFGASYQQNMRIEKWVEDINMETGISQIHYDNYVTECQGGQSDGKQDIRQVKTMFASPDRFLRKMKENKVGVAAKMFSNAAKNDSIDDETQNGKIHLGMNRTFIKETKTQTDWCKLPSAQSKLDVYENEDIFIVEDDFDNKSKCERQHFNKNRMVNRVSQSVPAVKLSEKRAGIEGVLKEVNTNSTMDRPLESNIFGNKLPLVVARDRLTRSQHRDYIFQNLDNIELGLSNTNGETSIEDPVISARKSYLSSQNQDTNIESEDKLYSDLYPSVKDFKKKSDRKRKFVPPENTANLIELMLQPDTEVATFLSPRAFHKKYDKPVPMEAKPVLEILTCLSSQSNTQTVKRNSTLPNKDSYKNQDYYSKSNKLSSDNLRSPNFKRKILPAWSPATCNDLKNVDTVNFKIQQDKSSSTTGYGNRCSTQNMSPYRSAKDLSNIELYVNSSFCSPDVQKSRQTLMEGHDISKSVPAKLQCITKDSMSPYNKCHGFSSPVENRFITCNRTKLKAKRSLHLIENDHNSGCAEATERQPKEKCKSNAPYSPFSKEIHTPSKTNPFNFSVNEESPSTVLSRLLLNTPSPTHHKSSEKFRRFKSRVQQMTQPLNTMSDSSNGDGAFKRPFINKEGSESNNELNNVFSKPARTNLVTRYRCDQKVEKSDYLHTQRSYGTDLAHSKRNTSNEHFIKPKYYSIDDEKRKSKLSTSDQHFIKPEIKSVDNKNRGTETSMEYRRENSNRLKNIFSANTDESRRKALFQSTPMKSSQMFQLDNTMSTIYSADLDDDDSDCEVVTISNSP